MDTSTYRGDDFAGTDHFLVMAKLKLKLKRSVRKAHVNIDV
jgi:hypothetical protein